MEPMQYVRLVRRRWYLAVTLGILGLVAGYLIGPSPVSPAQQARQSQTNGTVLTAASAILTTQPLSSDTATGIPTISALGPIIQSPSLAQKAAADIGYKGNAVTLAQQLTITTPTTATIAITEIDFSSAFAVTVANAFAKELVTDLTQLQEANLQTVISAQQQTVNQLQGEINTLQGQVPTDPHAVLTPAQTVAKSQLAAVLNAYTAQYQRYITLTQQPPPPPPLIEIEPAIPVPAATSPILHPPKAGAGTTSILPTPVVAPTHTLHRRAKLEYAALGLIVGIILGFGLAIGMFLLDPRIRGRAEAETVFGFPVLVEIPRLPSRSTDNEITAAAQPSSSVADAYRNLRSALLLTEPAGDPAVPPPPSALAGSRLGTVVVVSAGLGDGKTSTVANLAASLAETQRTIVAVSGDFRRPTLHRRFDRSEAPGLADVLALPGTVTIASALQDVSVAGVKLLASGTPVSNEITLLAGAGQVMANLRRHFDAVVVDTPGVLLASDASEFLGEADSVLIVGRVGRTRRSHARQAADYLRRLGAPVLGVVLISNVGPGRKSNWVSRTTPASSQAAVASLPNQTGATPPAGPESVPAPSGRLLTADDPPPWYRRTADESPPEESAQQPEGVGPTSPPPTA
jgi:Mrp family chromosome partitioning ATPase/capsular polysaccharide biosynthesis protein